MPIVLAVAAGGALGAAGRYGLDRLIERRSFAVFPWSTFTINVSGLRAEDVALALLYSLGSLACGVLAVLGGTMLGRTL